MMYLARDLIFSPFASPPSGETSNDKKCIEQKRDTSLTRFIYQILITLYIKQWLIFDNATTSADVCAR